jgi:putative flavoprotein involved in K+ transport
VPLFSRERRPEPIFGDSYEQLRRVGVTIAAAVQDAAGAGVTFADGTQASPRSVILATGYTLATTGSRNRPASTGRGAP